MFEILKRFALIGLGAISLSEEKVKELIKEMVKRGEVSEGEGEDLFKGFVKWAGEEKCGLEEWMKKRLGEILEKMDLVTKDRFADLEKKVNALNRMVKELKKAKGEG